MLTYSRGWERDIIVMSKYRQHFPALSIQRIYINIEKKDIFQYREKKYINIETI